MKKKTIRQSKRLIISLSVTFFCLTASAAQAQTALVTIDLQQVKMVQVMDEIENQTKYLFIYDKNMDTGRLVNVHVNKRPVAEALDQMVKGTDVVYEIQGSNIILTVRSQQTDGPKVVSGKVTDNKGDAVIGAAILVKGTTVGTSSGVDGVYTLRIPEVNANTMITVNYLGYEPIELLVGTRERIDIVLQEQSLGVDAVVVTALGIKKQEKALTYNVQEVSGSIVNTVKDANFVNSLSGKIAGLQINASASGAGGSTRVVMRGVKSINGDNNALYVVDGIPLPSLRSKQTEGIYETPDGGDYEGIANINPEDIESLSILKGASATALYGSEAANGAVVITSKRAKSGKLTVDFNAQVMANLPAYLPKVQTVYGPGTYNTAYSDYEKQTGGFYQRTLNGQSYKSLRSTTLSFGPKYDGSEVLYWDGKMRPYQALTDNPWKELFRTGWTQTYNLAISQGTETTSNRFSYTFMDEIPNALTGSFTKHNFKLTGSYQLAKPLKLEYSLNYIVQNVEDRPQTSLNLYSGFGNMFSTFLDIPYLKQSYVTSLGYRNTFVGGN